MESQDLPEEFVAVLRAMFGDHADEAIEALSRSGFDPRSLMQAAGLGDDPQAFARIMGEVNRMMRTQSDGPVNWPVTHDIARRVAVEGGDLSLTDHERAKVAQALSVADLWLDAVTDFPAAPGSRLALSRSEWVERTMATWQKMAEPIAASVADEMARAIGAQGEEHPGLEDMAGGASDLVRSMGGTVFGMQLGHAVGTLSREVFGLHDIGIPLTAEPVTALVPAGVTAFGTGLEVPLEEVTLFLATREAAHARLFAAAPWLGPHLFGAVADYARFLEIDTEAITRAVADLDPSDPESMRAALSGGVFEREPSERQQIALTRLEDSLALVEGWVDEVTARAVAPHLPDAGPLREMMRRRRAAGGPAEHTFATLVGLRMRPRRARDAATLFSRVFDDGGAAARDRLWGHPDLLPTPEDLDAPEGFVARQHERALASAEMDDALAAILGEADSGPAASPSEPEA